MKEIRDYLETYIDAALEDATPADKLAEAQAQVNLLRSALKDATMQFELLSLRYVSHREMLVREVERLRAELREVGGDRNG